MRTQLLRRRHEFDTQSEYALWVTKGLALQLPNKKLGILLPMLQPFINIA